MYFIKFEDPDSALPGERKSKRLMPHTPLVQHLEGIRMRLKKRVTGPVRGDDRPWHIELLRSENVAELVRRAKALEGREIDAEDPRRYHIVGRALVLRVGYVANYGDAHITVAFFPEGAPSWLQRKLPEVVCCASAISAYAMQPVSIPMPKPAQPPNSISDYWAIASPCMYNDVARLREALANPSVNPTMGSARGLWAGSKHKRQSWDAIAVLVADPRVDARDRYSGLPVVDRLFAHAPPSIAEAMLASGRYDAEWLLEKSVEFDRGTWVRAIVGSGRVPPERVEAMYKLARKSGKTYAESGFSAHFANARELIDRRAYASMREWAQKEQEETPMETPSADDKDWEML